MVFWTFEQVDFVGISENLHENSLNAAAHDGIKIHHLFLDFPRLKIQKGVQNVLVFA